MWGLPGPGVESVSPTLAGRFFNTEPPGKPLPVLNMWPGFQEVVCRVAYSLSFLLLFSVPLNHVSARPFQLYYWKWHHPSRFDILSPAKRSDSPSSHSAVGRIAPWSFHCLQVVDKWQTWPKYLCVIGSGDALEFLSSRKMRGKTMWKCWWLASWRKWNLLFRVSSNSCLIIYKTIRPRACSK